jgi:MFS superfamily sulfate permease-like transporter
VKRVVVTAAPITSVDVTSADSLAELLDTLKADNIEFFFAEMKDPVKDKLRRFGLFDRFGDDRFFPTIESAVANYLREHKVKLAHGVPTPGPHR